jgi:hypothetical protein
LTPAAPVGPQATTQTAGLTQPPPPLVQAKPAADPAVVGPAVASAAAAAGCSFLATTTGQDGVRVTGYVAGGDAQADINRAAQGLPVAWDAQAIDPYWCHTLDTLRPLASAGMMQVTLANASGALRDGDLIMPDVAGPDFPHWMVVDDFTLGGKTPDNTTIGPNVVHFYPTAAVRARRQAAGEMLQVRDKSWAVGPPFGTDLLIAVASSNPLFRAKRPAQEDFDAYLSALHMALDAAAKRGDKVAIGIGLLRTEAK